MSEALQQMADDYCSYRCGDYPENPNPPQHTELCRAVRASLRGGPPLEPSQEAPEQLAQRFHETYERLAPSFGYRTREASAKPWNEVPEQNRRLMVAVCAEVLDGESTCPDCGGTGRKAPDVGIFRTLPCHCPAGASFSAGGDQ